MNLVSPRVWQVLLLGAGESGKSTFSKQLKLLNKGVISENDKLMYRKGEAQQSNLPQAEKRHCIMYALLTFYYIIHPHTYQRKIQSGGIVIAV